MAEGAMKPMTLPYLKAGLTLALVATLLVAGAGLAVYQAPAAKPAAAAPGDPLKPVAKTDDRSKAAEAKPVRTDRYGDLLPEGAVARLGTVRFRPGYALQGAALSRDGKTGVTVGGDGSIRVWEMATGKEIQRLMVDRGYPVAVAYSPDGRTVATIHQFGGIQFWDPATGKETRQIDIQQQHTYSLAFSPDGRRLAVGGMGPKPIQVWDITGKEARSIWEVKVEKRQDDLIRATKSLAFSPDGKILASGDLEGIAIHLRDAGTGKELRQIEAHDRRVNVLAFSPDGKWLVSGGGDDDRSIRLWEVDTGRQLRQLTKLQGGVESLAFSPDGKMLASGGGEKDPLLSLWEVNTWKEIGQLGNRRDKIVSLDFTPDSKHLVAGAGGAIRMWEVATGKELGPSQGHQNFISSVQFSPDGRIMATGGGDRTIRLWDSASFEEIRVFEGHEGWVRVVGFVAGSKILASASDDKTVRLWEVATGKETHRLEGHLGSVYSLAISPDGKILASGDYSYGTVRLWDVANGQETRQLKHPDGMMCLAFPPDGKILATGEMLSKHKFLEESNDALIRLWDMSNAKVIRELPGHKMWVNSIAFSPDGNLLASVGDDKYLRLWEVSTGKQLWQTEPFPYSGQTVCFSPDGKTLASAGYDKTIRLWEIASKKERRQFKGHQAAVKTLAFSPDGRTLISGSMDTTALVWNVTGVKQGKARQTHLSPKELETLWTALADDDASVAFQAVWSLAAGQDTVPFLRERLHPTSAVDTKHVSRLLADLDSDRFAMREKAAKELEQLGRLAEPALRKALAGRPSLEARRRLEKLLVEVRGPIRVPETLRALRAIEVQEDIGTPEAQEVLKTLSKGVPEALVTQEAKSSLARLAKRTPNGH